MKVYYEKFCFIRGYRELNLFEEDNLKVLKRYGFEFKVSKEINFYYTNIKFRENYKRRMNLR
jgi:hypothetical protein